MSIRPQQSIFYIGWDVGGWNCDKNKDSRDAVVILGAELNLVGRPWRGNLRTEINAAADASDWIKRLFDLCMAVPPSRSQITMAIDTPLGFSDAFIRLVTRLDHAGEIGSSATNPYLFRYTERYLFEHGLKPLSAIKDMIGSQATKGMHALARFTPKAQRCGVWTDGADLTAIEAYPSACKGSATVKGLRERFGSLGHADLDDALTCALLAYLFTVRPDTLAVPPESTPVSEGWIWVPQDSLSNTIRCAG